MYIVMVDFKSLILNPSLLKGYTLKLQVYTKKLIFTYTTTRYM